MSYTPDRSTLFSRSAINALDEFFDMMDTYPGLGPEDEDVVLHAIRQSEDEAAELWSTIREIERKEGDLTVPDVVRVGRAQDRLQDILQYLVEVIVEVRRFLSS